MAELCRDVRAEPLDGLHSPRGNVLADHGRGDRCRAHAHAARPLINRHLEGVGSRPDRRRGAAPRYAARSPEEGATGRSQAGGHPTWPALDLPAQAASAGSCARCGDSSPPTPRGSGPMPPALAASSRLASWPCCGSLATRSARRAVWPLYRRYRGQGRGVPAVGSERHPAGGPLGLLTIQERRREGQKNLPNIVRVISREWLAWLRIGARRMAATPASGGTPRDMHTGCKNIHPDGQQVRKKRRAFGAKGCREQGWPSSGAEAMTVRARRLKRPGSRRGLGHRRLSGVGRPLAALPPNARPGASL